MKRVFSFLLVLLLVVGLVPVQAMAETAAASAQHNITVIVEGNGTASASPAAASAGENVTINWQAAGTHELKKITGVGPEGSFQIYPHDDEFTMPDGAVTVTVKFGPIGDSEGDEPGAEENGPRSVMAYCYLGAGNPAAPATANPGDTVTITPNPADGYTFQSMRVDYVDVYGEHYDEYTVTSFTMPNADVKVYVTYVKENANGARNIQVSSHSCTVAAPTTAMPGDTVNITVTPDTGYTLPDQYLSVKYMTTNKFVFPDKNGGHNYSFTMPDEDVYISAICVPGEDAPQPPQPAEYTITLDPNTDTAKGTAVFPAKAKAGDTVTITATANDGFYVMAANVSTEQDNPVWDLSKTGEGTYKFTMPAENVKVHILFQAETLYDVTVAPTQNGTATADPTKALMGRPVVITTTPAEGYQVDTITVTADNGQNVPVQDGNKFFMPDSNVTVTVTFDQAITVTFDHNNNTNGTTEKVIVKGDKVVDIPSAPESDSSSYFIGWYVSPEKGSDPMDPNATYEKATTFYAHWVNAYHTTNPISNDFHVGVATGNDKVTSMTVTQSDLDKKQDMKVYLTSTNIQSTIDSSIKSTIDAAANGQNVVAYLDLTLHMSYESADPRTIGSVAEPLDIFMEVPPELVPANAGTNAFKVIHYTGGSTEVIGATFDPSSRILRFKASSFSPYALAYNPQTSSAPAPAASSAGILDNVPKTGDDAALLNWMLLILCSTAMLAGVAVLAKKRAR